VRANVQVRERLRQQIELVPAQRLPIHDERRQLGPAQSRRQTGPHSSIVPERQALEIGRLGEGRVRDGGRDGGRLDRKRGQTLEAVERRGDRALCGTDKQRREVSWMDGGHERRWGRDVLGIAATVSPMMDSVCSATS
jgi:hypothetical protein